MATLFSIDGTETEVLPKNGQFFDLKEMQEIVGGYIEFIYLSNDRILVINEEGKLEGLPYNFKASMYANEAGIAHDDFVVGPALLCQKEETGD